MAETDHLPDISRLQPRNADEASNKDLITPLGTPPGRFARILAFDAGGAGCVSSLAILRKIMHPYSADDTAHPEPSHLYPCQHFEMICGSEWGGVLSVMLGRLRMSVQECQEWFSKPEIVKALHLDKMCLWQRLSPVAAGTVVSKRTEILRRVFTKLLEDRAVRPDLPLLEVEHLGREAESRDTRCRTLVFATNLTNLEVPVKFTSYTQGTMAVYNILEVMMAAVALPGQTFPVALPMDRAPTTEPNMECVSASISGYSNPSFQILIEAQQPSLWNPGEIHSILSIGCGLRQWKVAEGWARSRFADQLRLDTSKILRRVATDTERTEAQVRRLLSVGPVKYYRFNLPVGVVSADIGDWAWTLSSVFRERLERYCDLERGNIRECYERLRIAHGDTQMPESHPSPPANADYAFDMFPGGEKLTRNGPEIMDAWILKFQREMGWLTRKKIEKKVRVAVLDTGINASHPDIQKLWHLSANPDERAAQLREHYGDFTTDEKEPGSGPPVDEEGHGTHVAGVFLQLADNAELYVGRVMKGRTVRSSDRVIGQRVSNAIRHAVDKWNVQVICISFGFLEYSDRISSAIAYARNKNGCVVFAAAGNNGKQSKTCYPARSPDAICVRSADALGVLSDFNPPARSGIKYYLPGERVASTWPKKIEDQVETPSGFQGIWRRLSGTSTATPIAAAIAAQILHFQRYRGSSIPGHQRLEGISALSGIQSILLLMQEESFSGELSAAEHVIVAPWAVLGDEDTAERRLRDALELSRFS